MAFLAALCLLALPLAGMHPDAGGQTPASAGPLQPSSNEALQKAASQGDAAAAHALGERYAEGRMGLPKDETKAAALYQQAAAKGFADAQADLGWFYMKGLGGLPVDEAKAFTCFQQAAKQGHRYATHMLGWMYELGRGIEQDDRLAAEWHEKASKLGDMDSLASLGWLTQSGRGVPKNEAAAAQMYAVAARNGNAMAMTNLGWFFVEGMGGLQKDYGTARRLFESASSLGWARADGNLGYLYQNGLGVPKNMATALRWFKLSADAGDHLSQEHLGQVYEGFHGVERDLGLAFHYHSLGAAQGWDASINGLVRVLVTGYRPTSQEADSVAGWMERDLAAGRGRLRLPLALLLIRRGDPPADPARIRALVAEEQGSQSPSPLLPMTLRLLSGGALGKQYIAVGSDLLSKAAEQGGPGAKLEWAKTLVHGSSAERAQALHILEALEDQHHPEGTFELGLLYQNGEVVPRSPSKALHLFTAAANLGWAPAMFHLGLIHHQGIGVKKDLEQAKVWYQKAEAAGYPLARGRVRPDGSLAPLEDLTRPPAGARTASPR
ncbi:tetratricopeptide repeat protein [Geothrix terrae]|uniref:tetratricopeptide repeat protein n=1 Tax=Geothrix terrae TaxID=2922720 RepID=UPI001FAD9FB1|nr:tetratricopeptide repeat protein [Geothrix terrae]